MRAEGSLVTAVPPAEGAFSRTLRAGLAWVPERTRPRGVNPAARGWVARNPPCVEAKGASGLHPPQREPVGATRHPIIGGELEEKAMPSAQVGVAGRTGIPRGGDC